MKLLFGRYLLTLNFKLFTKHGRGEPIWRVSAPERDAIKKTSHLQKSSVSIRMASQPVRPPHLLGGVTKSCGSFVTTSPLLLSGNALFLLLPLQKLLNELTYITFFNLLKYPDNLLIVTQSPYLSIFILMEWPTFREGTRLSLPLFYLDDHLIIY